MSMTLDDVIHHLEHQQARLGVALEVLRALGAAAASPAVAHEEVATPKALPTPRRKATRPKTAAQAPRLTTASGGRRARTEHPGRAKAKALWQQGKTLKEIASALDVPYSTVYGWRMKDGWGAGGTAATDRPAPPRGRPRAKAPTSEPPAPTPASKDEVKDQARRLVETGLSFAAVAAKVGVAAERIAKWVAKEEWVTLRSPVPVSCPRCRKLTHTQPCEFCAEASWDLEQALRRAATEAA